MRKLIHKNRVSTRETTRSLPVLSTLTKILYGNVFQVGTSFFQKRLFVSLEGWGETKRECAGDFALTFSFLGNYLFSDQWEPLRGEECIRTVFDYCKGGQVYGSGINRTRLHALHGDVQTSFQLIIINSTSNSQKRFLVDCVRC